MNKCKIYLVCFSRIERLDILFLCVTAKKYKKKTLTTRHFFIFLFVFKLFDFIKLINQILCTFFKFCAVCSRSAI